MIESNSEGMNLQTETSNYASAETSPNPSLTTSSSSQSLRSNISSNGDDTAKSKISISSLLGNKSLHPSIDDPSIVVSHPLADITGPIKLVPSSTSTNALDKLLKHDYTLNNEFQSLPPILGNAKQANEIEKDLLSDWLKQKSENQTIQDLVKTTVTSLIENTVKTSIEEMTKEVQQEKEKKMASKLMPSLFPPLNTVSSSSPNPTCNPFKFLVEGNKIEIPSQEVRMAATLSPNGSTIQDAVSVFNAEQSKLSDSVIEKLAKLNHKEHEKEDPVLTASNTKSQPGITPSNSQIINHQSSIPASSQEFCMNLNLNLAAAADKETYTERFTSNASTSSIHNDLKMILEGNKPEEKKTELPKPQREKHNRSKSEKKEKKPEIVKNEQKNDELIKLVDMMKQMSENKGKPGLNIGGDESGKYRYTKEFLQQIRNERAAFIENTNPEIFKAYCYCMSGKYWDPEKYFDIIQYSGDYDRVVQQQQQQQQQASKNKKNVKNDKKFKSNNVKKNDANNNIKENILGCLGLKGNDTKQADKILLDMLKKNDDKHEKVNLIEMIKPKNSNILGELFNQNQNSSVPKHRPVILTAQELESSQINKPFNRLFTSLNQTPDVGVKVKSPNSCGSNTSESSVGSDANNSEAYKQLIKNLNNHPLCTPSATRGNGNFDNVLMKLQGKKEEDSKIAKDGTNLLNQLLHLNQDDKHKNHKNKRNNHHKHQKLVKPDTVTSFESTTTTTTTTTTITKTQFPTVNPHEKPFENVKPKNELENLFNKMKVQPEAIETSKNEKEHFNLLINKIMPTQKQEQPKQESILKWFSGMTPSQQQFTKPNFSARTLTEIELMSGHFP